MYFCCGLNRRWIHLECECIHHKTAARIMVVGGRNDVGKHDEDEEGGFAIVDNN